MTHSGLVHKAADFDISQVFVCLSEALTWLCKHSIHDLEVVLFRHAEDRRNGRAMLCRVVERPWELLVCADVVPGSWRHIHIFQSRFNICAHMNVIETTLLCRSVILIVGVGAWSLLRPFSLY